VPAEELDATRQRAQQINQREAALTPLLKAGRSFAEASAALGPKA
jgi:hypothetical protein